MNILGGEQKNVADHYALGVTLGKGHFGVTKLASELSTGRTFACKSIAKRKLTRKDDIDDIQREVQIMHHLAGHPNIVEMKDAYEDRTHVHLVSPSSLARRNHDRMARQIMEICTGGELFDSIVSRGHYSESDAAKLVRTMVRVVAHCHSMGVIHRDLKPENFLFASPGSHPELKCTDFGLSVFFADGERFSDIVGSAFYVAPEILSRCYGPQVEEESSEVITLGVIPCLRWTSGAVV